MQGAIIPLPPEWRAQNQPQDPLVQRIQANRDRSNGLDALTNEFLPRLREASDLLRSKRGQLLDKDLKQAFAAIDRLRIKVRDALPTQEARDWFDRLANNSVAIESNAMSRHVTHESWKWRARVSEDLLKSRINEAERFPEDDIRCREALLDGIAEIDAHALCHHHDDKRTAARTRRFRSDFAIGRLKGLAAIDPAKASAFFATAKDDVAPEKRAGIAALLARALDDVFAREAAAAIVSGRPPEGCGLTPIHPVLPDPLYHLPGWLAQADRVAAGHRAGDRSLRIALRAEVLGHVADRRGELGRKARGNRNRLLGAVLDGCPDPACHANSDVRHAWTAAPQPLRNRLNDLAAGTAAGLRPGLPTLAVRLHHRLRGMRRAMPAHFVRLDLSDTALDPLPPAYRRHWTQSQAAVDAEGTDAAKALRLLGWLEQLGSRRSATALDPNTKEWI